MRAEEDRKLDELRRKAYDHVNVRNDVSVRSEHQKIVNNLEQDRQRARE